MSRWFCLNEQTNDSPGGYEARRNVVTAAAMWPVLALAGAVFAQPNKPPVVIGWFSSQHRPEAGGGNLAEFKKELATLGWQEGANYVVEELYAAGQPNRPPALAEELAAKKAAVIVAAGSAATIAAAKAVPTIPIVQAFDGSPVNTGLAASLARPGGMVTPYRPPHRARLEAPGVAACRRAESETHRLSGRRQVSLLRHRHQRHACRDRALPHRGALRRSQQRRRARPCIARSWQRSVCYGLLEK